MPNSPKATWVPAKRAANDSPLWYLAAPFLLFLVSAGMGEWKTINNVLSGLPKAITLGIIALAVAYAFISPDFKRLRFLAAPTALYLSFVAALLCWSAVIWILNFIGQASMIRGCSKMLFQSISILSAVAAVYLFGEKAVDLFALGLCLVNGFIMLLEIPNFGLAESITSLVTCLVTFGDAVGYARNLEIHDLTFVFGQLVLYYAAFAPKNTRKERQTRRFLLFACLFFFLVGMKRIAIPAVVLFLVFALAFRRKKKMTVFLTVIGVLWIAFFFLYIYSIWTGALSEALGKLGVNMMGRDYLWRLAGDYYTFSPTFMGHGFEYVDTIVSDWYRSGLINHPYPFHNDILKVFVEVGFPGFLLWSGILYVAYPIFWAKYADGKTALLYMTLLSYMTVTYLTDNTAFYFWSTMSLRLVVLSYAFLRRKQKAAEEAAWRPESKEEIRQKIRLLMKEQL